MSPDRKRILIVLVCFAFIGCLLYLAVAPHVSAAPALQEVQDSTLYQISSEGSYSTPIVSNDVCLECHGKPGLTMTLLSGDVLDLYVNPDEYAASIHGKGGYACVQCHTNLGEYPHPPFTAYDLRDATLELSNACNRCHSGEYTLTMDSVHYDKQAKGIKTAAVCSDCHGAHNVRQWTDPETNTLLPEAKLEIPTTCSKCHFEIYKKYESSVHGAALTEESNTDVPTCIDCHGVHNIGNPTTTAFRINSPELCATCHTNKELMDKYGISTEVLNTYVSDFHGTTVALFEQQSPDAPTNKPVCYDCHGVHDISRVDDPKTGINMQENLLVRCKECHPDASANFPSAWMSHYIPSSKTYALVYYVNLFYKIFIPLVLGGMLALVGLDFGHSVYVKARHAKHPPESASGETNSPTLSEPPVQPQAEQKSEEKLHD
jgi:nitrate/TMAO reductase-like tetraheme cytochrome c subunit